MSRPDRRDLEEELMPSPGFHPRIPLANRPTTIIPVTVTNKSHAGGNGVASGGGLWLRRDFWAQPSTLPEWWYTVDFRDPWTKNVTSVAYALQPQPYQIGTTRHVSPPG